MLGCPLASEQYNMLTCGMIDQQTLTSSNFFADCCLEDEVNSLNPCTGLKSRPQLIRILGQRLTGAHDCFFFLLPITQPTVAAIKIV